MSRFLGEASTERAVGRAGFGIRQLERRPASPGETYAIKVVSDDLEAVSGVDHFIFNAFSEINGMSLLIAKAFVSTAGSTATTIEINQNGSSIMTTPITIDSGETSSETAFTQPVVAANTIATGDLIEVFVTTQGTGAMGHGVRLEFG